MNNRERLTKMMDMALSNVEAALEAGACSPAMLKAVYALYTDAGLLLAHEGEPTTDQVASMRDRLADVEPSLLQ